MVQVSTKKEGRPIRTDSLPPRWLPIEPQPASNNLYKSDITIATVLRQSPVFTPAWVDKLYRGVDRNLDRPFRFVCLTDTFSGFREDVELIPLKNGWQTKHSKLELFRPDLDLGRVLYMDLDTVVLGSLEDICSYSGSFAMLRDFSAPLRSYYGSGVMAWEPGFGHDIYAAFRVLPKEVRNVTYAIGGGRGDQLFINHRTLVAPHRLQDMFPGQLVSYRDVRHRCGMSREVRLAVFHGRDKPSSDMLPCIEAHWR